MFSDSLVLAMKVFTDWITGSANVLWINNPTYLYGKVIEIEH